MTKKSGTIVGPSSKLHSLLEEIMHIPSKFVEDKAADFLFSLPEIAFHHIVIFDQTLFFLTGMSRTFYFAKSPPEL